MEEVNIQELKGGRGGVKGSTDLDEDARDPDSAQDLLGQRVEAEVALLILFLILVPVIPGRDGCDAFTGGQFLAIGTCSRTIVTFRDPAAEDCEDDEVDSERCELGGQTKDQHGRADVFFLAGPVLACCDAAPCALGEEAEHVGGDEDAA